MSTTLNPVITSAGLNAVFNAQNNRLYATISEIALGDSAWITDNTATALQNEKRRISVSGERVNDSQINLTGVEDGTSLEYWVREVDFYLADGTLLAI
ncbi:phage tail-collar fiber domain-containing protein [Candidatus Vondammii sp. HM_W22]|uniref:phage tail-collar fiber domain-containing protein n=1 Tax=Candidatus Vondammii sp. HM_W22 TaxID=2687299 RepID=UPI001F1379BB|nr:phage tail protein [Candidatus Vondammii sp. HM_W22]